MQITDYVAPNTVIREMIERKSVRQFTEEPLTPEEKEAILLSAVAAPSAGCQQLYTILDITDPELKAALAESCDHQSFIARAPLVLVFCTDVRRWLDLYAAAHVDARPAGPGDLLLAVSDATIAAQNAVNAAWSLGIGSCYIGDIMENMETQRKLLSLPDLVFPCCMVVFGRPTDQQKSRVKPERVPLADIVHENGYHVRDTETLKAMTKKDWHATSFEEYMTRFCNRKYQSDFAREMNRSVARYLSQYM